MIYQQVDSTNIAAVALFEGTLHLIFRKGGVYRYPGAGLDVMNSMLASPSLGKFFHQEVKLSYPAEQLTPSEEVAFMACVG